MDSAINEELEVLQAIYMEDINVTRNHDSTITIKMVLHPSTADNQDKKFVCLTGCFNIPIDYPKALPKFEISQPRGLSDAHLTSIVENLQELMNQHIGETMLFQLIEYVRDSLTDNNKPSCSCAICLDHFKDEDDFLRTECYHYFHSFCFASYINASKDENDQNTAKLVCPVCRVELPDNHMKIDEGQLNQSLSKWTADDHSYELVDNLEKWRIDCERIFAKQKKAGGIIDPELEQTRFLIDSSSTVTTDETPDTMSRPQVNDTPAAPGGTGLNDERRSIQQGYRTTQAANPTASTTGVKHKKRTRKKVNTKLETDKAVSNVPGNTSKQKDKNQQRVKQTFSSEATNNKSVKKSDNQSPANNTASQLKLDSKNRVHNRTERNELHSKKIEREQKQCVSKNVDQAHDSTYSSANNSESVSTKRTVRPPPGFF